MPFLNAVDTVGKGHDVRIMGCHKQRAPGLTRQFQEQAQNASTRVLIKIAGRLVRENQCGLVNERPRDSDALLFPSAELVREVVSPMRQPDTI